MSEKKLSSELIDKIAKTELPEIKIRCDRDGFYNGLASNFRAYEGGDEIGLHMKQNDDIKALQMALACLSDKVVIDKPLKLLDEEIPQDMRNIGINIFRNKVVVDFSAELSDIEKNSINGVITSFVGLLNASGKTPEELRQKDSIFNEALLTLENHTFMNIKNEEDLLKAMNRNYYIEKFAAKRGGMCRNYPHCISLSDIAFICKKDDKESIEFAQEFVERLQYEVFSNFYHEIKHTKNELLLQHRPYASDYKMPTEKEKYLINVENERTATFNSVNEALKKYLKTGNYQDFSMFSSEMKWVVEKLKGKTPKQIKKLCYPPNKLMNECLENWNNDFLNQYFEQFQSVCKDNCCDSLLIPVDTSGNEFRKQRSLMYTYEVYNPYTNKTEMVDLSPAINVEIPISDKVKKDIIKPCEGEREKAKKELYALIPDKKTEILAANFAETLKREKMAQWLAKSKNSDAEAILDKVRFAQPVKISKRNFIAKQIKMAMRRLPSPERALKYAAVISAFVVTTGATTVMPSLLKGEKEQMSVDFSQTTRRKVSIEIGGKVADTEVVTRTLCEGDAEVLVGTWKSQLNDSKER